MKIKDIYDELFDLSKKSSIIIRKESGTFKSGYCKVKDSNVVVLNKMASLEYSAKILAMAMHYFDIDKQYLKPAIRDFIDAELAKNDKAQFEINITENLGSS